MCGEKATGMAVVFTYTARVRDWKRLQAVSRQTLIQRAKEAGAHRYQLYRNSNDASELLIVAEFPDRDAACEMSKILNDQLGDLLAGGLPDDRFWEPCGWETLGEPRAGA